MAGQKLRARFAALAAAAFGLVRLRGRRGRRAAFLLCLQGQFGLPSGGWGRGLFAPLSENITGQRGQLPGHRRQLLLQLRDAFPLLRKTPLLVSVLKKGGFQLSHAAFL